MTCISPLPTTQTCTRSTTITVNGEEIKMHVDISLDGNTGVPTFTTQQPDRLRNFIGSLTADFSAFPRETHFIDKPIISEELEKAIIEDKDGVVKDAYDEVISSVKEQIEAEGGDVDVFEQRIAENTSEGEEITDGLENQNLLDNDEEVSGEGESDDTIVEPEPIEAHQFVPSVPLVYPADMFHGDGTESQDYMFFEQFEYSPANPLEGQMLTDEGMIMEQQGDTQINSVPNVLQFGVRRESNIRRDENKNIKNPQGTCTLPIPNKLGVSNGVSWGEARANAIELAGFSAANSTIRKQLENLDIGDLIKKGIKGGGDTFNELKEQVQNPDPANPDAGSIISATLAKAVLAQLNINVDIDQFITRQTGAALNPNLELLFGGPQLRSFSFNFDFAPNNAKEADVVRQIQRWFRQGMLPTRRGVTGTRASSLFLGSPNIFRLSYRNRGRRIKSLNLIKICALTSCQIDFTPDGTYQSYEDTSAFSQPVRSTMGVTFNELTPIFRDDYSEPKEGFSRDPSLLDLGSNITGNNAISNTDIGF